MSKQLIKRICLLTLTALFAMSMANVAFAGGESVDFGHHGSITVTLRDPESREPVPDACFALYCVGLLAEDEESIHFERTVGFSEFAEDINNYDSPGLSTMLSAYVLEKQVDVYRLENAGENGEVVFEELPLGLYLIVQPSATSSHLAGEPFLVALPLTDPASGQWIYNVDANPKAADSPLPSDTPKPTPPPPPGERLPQTGMLLWPIPMLAALGLMLFSAGWLLNKSDEDET